MRSTLVGVLLLAALLAAACVVPTPTPTPLPPTPTATPEPTPTPAPPTGGALLRVMPQSLALAPGGLAVVQIEVLVGDVGISAADLTLSYDAAGLQVLGVEPGALLGEAPLVGFKEIDQEAGEVRIALARVGRTRVPTPGGTLVVVSLQVRTASPNARLPLHLAQVTLVNQDIQEIPEVQTLDGEIQVVSQ